MKFYKRFSFFLSMLIIFLNFNGILSIAYGQNQETFIETFDNLNLTGNLYKTGNFEGNYGITWYYQDARGDFDSSYEIDGKGIMIRRSNNNSKIYAKDIPGGISSFSVDLKKYWTTSDIRIVELLVNDVIKGSFTLQDYHSENYPVEKFTVENINIKGNFKLEIRHGLTGSPGAGIIVDNITWTSYSTQEEVKPIIIQHIPVSSGSLEEDINIYFTIDNNKPSVTTKVYYKNFSENQFSILFPKFSEGVYRVTIPPPQVLEDIQYYIEAYDLEDTARHPQEGIHTINIFKPHDPQKPISVEEAILYNRGIATVEGYIVATTTSGPVYKFYPPFTVDTNLALADSLDEKDISKILPVQLLDTSIRTNLNLKDNPQNLGRKIQITGSLETFFSVAGLRKISSYKWVENQQEEVAKVIANPPSGIVDKGTKIILTTSTEDAKIYYTLDSSIPDENSIKYTEGIPIIQDTTIKTIALKEGKNPSPLEVYNYTLSEEPQEKDIVDDGNNIDKEEDVSDDPIDQDINEDKIIDKDKNINENNDKNDNNNINNNINKVNNTATKDTIRENNPIKNIKEVTKEDDKIPQSLEKIQGLKELKDLLNHWSREYVVKLMELKAVVGYEDNSFKPEQAITRAEFLTILMKFLNLEEKEGKIFDDTINHWAKKYITIAFDHGIIKGYNNKTFGPDKFITREEMAIMLAKFMELQAFKSLDNKLYREDKNSFWRENYVEITNSFTKTAEGGNKALLKEHVKRGEAAKIIVEFLKINT